MLGGHSKILVEGTGPFRMSSIVLGLQYTSGLETNGRHSLGEMLGIPQSRGKRGVTAGKGRVCAGASKLAGGTEA